MEGGGGGGGRKKGGSLLEIEDMEGKGQRTWEIFNKYQFWLACTPGELQTF